MSHNSTNTHADSASPEERQAGNLDVVVTAATLTGGLANSNMTVNTAGNASSATAQVRIVGVKDSASLTFPAAAGTTLICRINESTNDAVGV